MCASQWVLNRPRGAMKAKAPAHGGRVGIPGPGRGAPTTRPVRLAGGAECERTR